MSGDRFGIVGKVIARTYEIRDVVAEGGFGVVYRAYHRGFRAEVALKCLKIPGELTEAQRKAFLEQFRGEAEVLFRLSAHHAHIVRPLHVDAFQTPENPLVPFMALEWLEGRTLDALIVQRRENGRPPLSLTTLARLLTPVEHALEQAHNLPSKDGPQTVIHRDMKPENLFITRVGGQDVAKVLDFGISKVKSTAGQLAGRASVKDADALVSFSPAYGAPEQWAPRRFGQTGRWTDVWGLALTVVEAAKGDEVIQGDQAAMMGTILDPARRPTPRQEGLTVSDAVETIFERALALDPRSRYQTIGEFWDAFTAALEVQNEVGPVSVRHQRAGGQLTSGMDSVMPSAPERSLVRPADRVIISPAASPSVSAQGAGVQRQQAPTPVEAARPRALAQHRPTASAAPLSEQPQSSPITLGGVHLSRPRGVPLSSRPYSTYPKPSVWKALSPSFSLMGLSVAITVLDRAIAHAQGVPLTFGPVHASWVAGGCMIVALVLATGVLRRAMDD